MALPGSNDYIFPGRLGGKRAKVRGTRKIMDQAGIPKSFRPCHGLRHWYATALVDAGQPIHVVSRLLGHSTIAMTERYYVARESALQAAVEVISEVIG